MPLPVPHRAAADGGPGGSRGGAGSTALLQRQEQTLIAGQPRAVWIYQAASDAVSRMLGPGCPRRPSSQSPYRLPPCSSTLQGAVRQFVLFFGGLGVAMVTLKSMDRLLYSLEET